MLGVGVAEQGGDFLDRHDGSGQETLRNADFPLCEVLHGSRAEFLPEDADDVHFRDAEVLRDDIEREFRIDIGIDVRADFFVERVFFHPVGEEYVPVHARQNLKQQARYVRFDF